MKSAPLNHPLYRSAVLSCMKLNQFLTLLFVYFTVGVGPASAAGISSVHCPLGCPQSPAQNHLVFGHLYALSNNPQTKFSDWVAYEVNPVNFGDTPGRRWAADPLLDEQETLEANDYKSASKIIGIDRGHQAPLASFAGSRYWSELNYLSNITPQKKALNQGAWKNLEEAVRNAASYKRPLYVITGTWYDPAPSSVRPELPGADESHSLPAAYYKIIYTAKGDASLFYMPQDLPRSTSYCSQRKGLAFLQSRLDYQLPLAAMHFSNELNQQLGCL